MAGRTRAGSTRTQADENTADENTAEVSTDENTATTDTSGPEAQTDEKAESEGMDTAQSDAGPDAGAIDAEKPEVPPEEALLDGAEPTWESALPLIAMMAGGSTSLPEAHAGITIWRMLRGMNDSGTGPTTMQLAAEAELQGAAGIDGTMVSRILSRYQSAGMVRSEEMNGIPRWHYTTPRAVFEKAATAAPVPARSRPATTGNATHSAPVRQGDSLPRGEITRMIDDYIHEHPDQNFGPGEIGEVFGRRYGTTRGALDSLVSRGRARQLDTEKLRYQAL